jgi:hypothetical protein
MIQNVERRKDGEINSIKFTKKYEKREETKIKIIKGIYFSFSEKNQSKSTFFFALLKITERQGFGSYSHQRTL